MTRASKQRGTISILVLFIGITITIIVGGLTMVASTQLTNSLRTESFEKALAIAQSGAEYYRWHLSHAPTDYTDGTGQPGPYTHEISDSFGNSGSYQLTITPPTAELPILTVTSRGWLNSHPDIVRTVITKYSAPSFTKYSFLNNANMWFGKKTTISGKVFSNGGIRMDGTHDSTVESARQTYTCGDETGCSPATIQPGIWGEGGPSTLWRFPVTQIDFNQVDLNFATMKTAAQTSGTYLPPSQAFGYHIIFSANGSYNVKKITNANSKKGWSVENGCETLYQVIQSETDIGTYTIDAQPLLFAEDHLWVEGVVNGKATVVAARFPLDLNKMNIWIPNSLTYLAHDGNHTLGLIAQENIIFALDVPQILNIDGALFAHGGRILRHNYKYTGCQHHNNAVRQQLNIYGSGISYYKSYWSYGQGGAGYGNDPVSGFSQVNIAYDPTLYYQPPPYFPAQGEYEQVSWEEE